MEDIGDLWSGVRDTSSIFNKNGLNDALADRVSFFSKHYFIVTIRLMSIHL